MASNYSHTGTDLDSLLAPLGSGWPTAGTQSFAVGGTDIASRYAIASSGTAYGSTTGYTLNGIDVGTIFAGLGTTNVVVSTISTLSVSAALGAPSGTGTTGTTTVTASKGKQSGYTYTWVITGAGTINGQSTSTASVTATVGAGSTTTGSIYCAVSDGTTTTNTNTVGWSVQNTSSAFTMRVAVDSFFANPARYYSADGVTWGTATGTTFGGMYSGASTNNIKIMVGSSNNATISTDGGATWSAHTYPQGTYINGSNNVFQLMPASTESITAYYSTDGVTLTSTLLPSAMIVQKLGSNGAGHLVGAAAYDSAGNPNTISIISTDNGHTWSLGGALPSAQHWAGVVWLSGTTYVAFSPNTNLAITTNGGTAWSNVNGGAVPTGCPSSMAGVAMASNGSIIVIGSGSSGSSAGQTVSYSTNGTTWTPVVFSGVPGFSGISVTYINGFFLAAGYTGQSTVWKSTNGITWTPETIPGTSSYVQVVC